MKRILLPAAGLLAAMTAFAQGPATGRAGDGPTMGWSSWNTYRVNISDSLIRRQADAMVATGLSSHGYNYINIDDGYFGGRDSVSGRLLVHPRRFPNGLKPVVDYIHGLGLRAGIYSDGGTNTCGSYYDNDSLGMGVGLYGHDRQDCDFFFKELGFDFIKVDFCGGSGKKQKGNLLLDERERYTAIADAISATGRSDVRLNVCRWDYPGTWVHDVAFSWRTTRDIANRWSVVGEIIRQNLYMRAYAWGGHYNDMDMLEVGRGLTEDEDRTHFGLWCFMNSPLLIGCDLTTISPRTLALLTNDRLIALNQDALHDQPAVVERQDGCFILVRDILAARGNDRAFAVYNPTDTTREVTVSLRRLLLGGKVTLADAFSPHDDARPAPASGLLTLRLGPHATAIYTAHCQKRLQQTRYEAEAAYISDYQELKNNQAVGTGVYEYDDSCSGGLKAAWLGGRPDNDLVFRDVSVGKAGRYTLTIATAGGGPDSRQATGGGPGRPLVSVDGGGPGLPLVSVDGGGSLSPRPDGKAFTCEVRLAKGRHTIRLHNDTQRMPDIDYIELARAR